MAVRDLLDVCAAPGQCSTLTIADKTTFYDDEFIDRTSA
jgi:hypothetical protein